MLWKSNSSELFVIDHNLIFDEAFNKAIFWDTHVFNNVLNRQGDVVERMSFEKRLQKTFACWESVWDKLPNEWIKANEEMQGFEPEKHRQRLSNEANGGIWLKLS